MRKEDPSIRDTLYGTSISLYLTELDSRGIAYTMTAVDTDTQQVEKMFGVNVFGPMRMVRVFHRMIIAAKGRIVNIG